MARTGDHQLPSTPTALSPAEQGRGPGAGRPASRRHLWVTTAELVRQIARSARQLVASTDGPQRNANTAANSVSRWAAKPQRRRPSPVRQRSSSVAPPRAVDDGHAIDPGAPAEPAGHPVGLSALLQRQADVAVQLTDPRLCDPAPGAARPASAPALVLLDSECVGPAPARPAWTGSHPGSARQAETVPVGGPARQAAVPSTNGSVIGRGAGGHGPVAFRSDSTVATSRSCHAANRAGCPRATRRSAWPAPGCRRRRPRRAERSPG